METVLVIFAVLVFLHFLMDYPLQGEFLSKAKNRFAPIPHVPWYQAMVAHTFMHGIAVYIVLGVWWIAILEMVSHFYIDDRKCAGELTFNQDQAYHISLKAVWLALALLVA